MAAPIRETAMTYRNTLIARTQHLESEPDEPAVLDYLQLRNRQCLYDWQVRRAEYESAAQRSRANDPKDTPPGRSALG
jgi:hypothetical protein